MIPSNKKVTRSEVMFRQSDHLLWGIAFYDQDEMILATRNINHAHTREWPGFTFKDIQMERGERLLGIKSN